MMSCLYVDDDKREYEILSKHSIHMKRQENHTILKSQQPAISWDSNQLSLTERKQQRKKRRKKKHGKKWNVVLLTVWNRK